MPVEFKDYYQSLGIAREASQDEIRTAFRKLARKYHPDVAKDKKAAEEKFKEINEAYEVLGDPAKRKKYDTLGANWNRPEAQGGWRPQGGRGAPNGEGGQFDFEFGGTGFSDFFEQFFGGGAAGRGFSANDFGRGQRQGRESAGPMRGAEIEGDILVSLSEAMQGSVRTISFRRQNRMTGQAVSENFRVRIPAGVQEGQLIRVPGKGEEGRNGGSPGDLYLRVRFEQHPDFRTRGSDLFYDLDLAPWEAVLGTTITIPALDGPVSVRVPAGTRKGQQLRVRGKGLPAPGGTRGDLYAAIAVEVPSDISDEERALWRQLAEKSNFNPRK
jgi:curved DNA-binding protein